MQQILLGLGGGVRSAEQIELLVVGGGGGAGGSAQEDTNRSSGGGGAGGFRYYPAHSLAGSPLQISIGTGGAG